MEVGQKKKSLNWVKLIFCIIIEKEIMETIIILLIGNIFIVIIGIIINTRVSIIRKNKWIEFMVDRITIENINLTDCFSKDVISLYYEYKTFLLQHY